MATAKKVDSASWQRLTDYVYKLEHRLAALEGGGRRQTHHVPEDTFRFSEVVDDDIEAGSDEEIKTGKVREYIRSGDELANKGRALTVNNTLPVPFEKGDKCMNLRDTTGQQHIFPYPHLLARVELSSDLESNGTATAKFLDAGDDDGDEIEVQDYMLKDDESVTSGRLGLAVYLTDTWWLIAVQCEE